MSPARVTVTFPARLACQEQSVLGPDQHPGAGEVAQVLHASGVRVDHVDDADRAARLARHEHAAPGPDQRPARESVDRKHTSGLGIARGRDRDLAARLARQKESLLGPDQHAAGEIAHGVHGSGVGVRGDDTKPRRVLRQRGVLWNGDQAEDRAAGKSEKPVRRGRRHA